jgi:hypothetical protein
MKAAKQLCGSIHADLVSPNPVSLGVFGSYPDPGYEVSFILLIDLNQEITR